MSFNFFKLVLPNILSYISTGSAPFLINSAAITGSAQGLKDYRSSSNPYYWKNRKPDAAYWQQDVYYNINARIDETTNVIEASQQLEYWNNSPDTLTFVYFHLYQNAFIKGSYLQALQEEVKSKNVLHLDHLKERNEKRGTKMYVLARDKCHGFGST